MSPVQISLVDVASDLPETLVDNDYFTSQSDAPEHPMFRGTRSRRHMGADDTASGMIARAAQRIIDRLDLDVTRDIDVILTNVSLPDEPFTGCGAVVAKRLGVRPRQIVDLANGGCISFVFMLEQARALFATTGARSALIANVQTAAGRVFAHERNRRLPQSAVPGDGCGVAYVRADDSAPVLSIVTRNYPDFAEDMRSCGGGPAWWEPRAEPLNLDFSESKLASIIARGNRMVPDVLRAALDEARLAPSDVACLVTNQPNRTFLRNWREAIEMPESRHVDTFDDYGNLFGAAVPIGIEKACERGVLRPGDVLLIGGFSHAGDYAGAAAVRWRVH
ncbi:3-oxoacyl-ACP synthase III family protein [Caldimonas brevitalea]|uniref:3-oxoacyl-[acyl-carrier-protein] synthase III n=1 Tax=Caldimonas brevitalea TaxID=413882 RepID=A0A0G3BJB6_9BURK|nr:3-oxoacyl-[acyl-carrier-protein] synthase III C-terminal domain-containing protein [Caldimonas brevitalea]AKJ29544.1 3-oxoacyl-[acyl-carrier-protein] synthase III [Caldimonas brevitalea]